MEDEEPESAAAPDPDYGASRANGRLRYWLAKEALRQGEAQIKSQSETLTGFRTRATAVLGWTISGVLALGAAIAAGHFLLAGLSVALVMASAAYFCTRVLFPSSYSNPAWSPIDILDLKLETEMEVLEALAIGAAEAAALDDCKLKTVSRDMKRAYYALALAPVVGAAVLGLTLLSADVHSLFRSVLAAQVRAEAEALQAWPYYQAF